MKRFSNVAATPIIFVKTFICANFHCKIREFVLLDKVQYADQEVRSAGNAHLVSHNAHLVSDTFMIRVLSVNLSRSQFSSTSASSMVGKASKSTLKRLSVSLFSF